MHYLIILILFLITFTETEGRIQRSDKVRIANVMRRCSVSRLNNNIDFIIPTSEYLYDFIRKGTRPDFRISFQGSSIKKKRPFQKLRKLFGIVFNIGTYLIVKIIFYIKNCESHDLIFASMKVINLLQYKDFQVIDFIEFRTHIGF